MPTRSSSLHGVLPPHYLHELPAQEEERLSKIFNQLDHDGNGKIDVHDLSNALHKVGVHKRYAEVILLTFYLYFHLFQFGFINSFNTPFFFRKILVSVDNFFY